MFDDALSKNGDDPLDLDILVLPEATLILIAAVIEPLRAANRLAGQQLYRWRLLSPDGEPVPTASGLPIPVDGRFEPADGTAALVVVASYGWETQATATLRRQLATAARHRIALVGAETGGWVLAASGLLNGRRATTHWEDFEAFERHFPEVHLVRERFVVDGRRITTGGPLPTLDLMLELVRRRQGYTLALEVSRQFIYDPAGTAAATAHTPSIGNLRLIDARVAEAAALMEETIDTPLPLTKLARRVGVTARHLQTLFQRSLGVSPHTHYQALRLNSARRLVIETRVPVADIAAATGFHSATAFSRCYRARYGESPRATRRSDAAAR
ncbi:GlxA family transcriptional regulator [Rhodobium gokarnense]|uniref:Transcriptional regulator GlxA family with amidase domain n=1 Tax=Rhodobium gokarnense TaxID=364296 RepID=A0ABT3H7X4_9HYPH|nr:GlxA family transcriptional regulator [Rhodobium gokarnense]MCW2306493.1 transcriptional regulator GlxA family with amidase domain [Rhodobium gokarnense]